MGEREMGEIREAALDQYGVVPLLHNMSAKLLSFGIDQIDDEPHSAKIYRVPPSIWKVDPSAYEPDVVSIGPYHRQNPKLIHAMEDHKWRYMHNLLLRRTLDSTDSVDEVLKLCIDKVKQSEARARRCYKAPFDDMSNNDFVTTLVLDGCFILELFLTYSFHEKHDLIYAIPWMRSSIWRDLLKLENQIPFFILEDLFTTINIDDVNAADDHHHPAAASSSLSLKKLAFEYLIQDSPLAGHLELEDQEAAAEIIDAAEIYHLLHFYHMFLDPASTISTVDAAGSSSTGANPSGHEYSCSSVFLIFIKKVIKNYLMPHTRVKRWIRRLSTDVDGDADLLMIPCVTELRDAGIQFRIKPKAALLDVTFKDGVLYIPRLTVQDATNTLFLNLLALEQFCPNQGHYVTSYATFLDCIVNTAKDVTILEQCDIIKNMLGSEDEVALLINRLCTDATIYTRRSYLNTVFAEVNQYCGSKWHKHRASCMRDYFGNPWSILSLLAAVALLLMALIQVVFAILSYAKQ